MPQRGRWGSWWLLAAGLVGLAVFVRLYREAFPQAQVSLQVTRSEAVERARAFLAERGAQLADYRQAVQFRGDNQALVFLQRTLGLAQASRWAREEVPIWAWNVRWFKPGQKEEWRAAVGVDGRVVRFEHEIEEAAPGATLSTDSALAVAEAFLRDRGFRLEELERVEGSTQKREHRTDHRFVWERRGRAVAWPGTGGAAGPAGQGAVRLAVEVYGDAVGSYRHVLKVPEAFQREIERTTGLGQVLAVASLGLTLVLVLVALGLSIHRHRQGAVRWRAAFGVAAVVWVLALIEGVLSWPMARYGYPTELDWGVYVATLALALGFGTLMYGLWALLAVAAGESLGREVFPRSLAAWGELVRGRLGAPALARASWQGYAVGFALLGYLTAFYLLARRYLGAWLPAEGPYSSIFNVSLPFLAPLTISVVAAVTEETTYRLFGISLLRRYAKSGVLALVVPAAIWAFGHSNYPVFPVYLRGIELTIAGVLFGITFVRLGLVVCVVAHFVIDAVQIGMPLLAAGNRSYLISGVAVMGIALLPALVGWLAGRRRAAVPEVEP